MSYVTDFKEIFTNTPKYFENLNKKDINLKSAYIFYLVFASIIFVFNLIYFFVDYTVMGMNTQAISATTYLIIVLSTTLLFFLISPFIYTVLVHAGVRLIGKKKGFHKTFNAVTRTQAIVVVYSILLSLVSITVILVPFGELGQTLIGSILTFVINIVTLIHVIYSEVVGVSKLHDLSYKRSAACVIIPYALALLFFAIIGIIIFLVAFGFLFV